MMRKLATAALAAGLFTVVVVGTALGYTGTQAGRGRTVSQAFCVDCHGDDLRGGVGPALVGPGTLSTFSTTRQLHSYVSTNMPFGAGGSLSAQQYLEVISFIVQQRGVAADGQELTLANIDSTPLNPTPAPTVPPPPPTGRELLVIANERSEPDPNLAHNLPDLRVTIDGETVMCSFRTFYNQNGGLTRWGYTTSEVIEERENVFTQYYQRGVVDCQKRDGVWRMERRLAWDYVGGGVRGSVDMGVEPQLISEQPGEAEADHAGPWGHRISNMAIDGTTIGFYDFWLSLGGVESFGYPKTDARRDDDPNTTVRVPGATPGFIRQYFQSAVIEYHPGDPQPVKLRLLGDDLRNRLYPNGSYEEFDGFNATAELDTGSVYVPDRTTPAS